MFEIVATTIIGPAALVVVGAIVHRSLNKAKTDAKTAEAQATSTTAAATMLDTQRKSFEGLLNPMREELNRLRGRVTRLEDRLAEEQTVRRHAVAYIQVLLTVIRLHAPDQQPEIPPAISDYL